VQRLSLGDLSVTGQVRVDTNPGDIVVSEDGRRVVVSHFDLTKATAAGADVTSARATLAVLDPDTLALTGSPAPRFVEVCAAPHGVALSRPDGALAFVACYGEDAVAVVDLSSGEVTRVPVGPGTIFGTVSYGPYASVLSPDGARVVVTNLASRDLRMFDVEARTMEATPPIVLRGAPYFPAWSEDGATLWVPVQAPDALVRIDLRTGDTLERPLGEDEGCELPHQVVPLGEGRLAVVCEGDHEAPGTVLFVDATTLETTVSTEVGVFPDSLTVVRPVAP
jgi:DNA-binding beta-propeller fold protein YncE